MKKDNVYKITIAILLVLNLLQLIGFLCAPKLPPLQQGKANFEGKAEQMMDLSEEQKQEFATFVKEHKVKMQKLKKDQVKLAKDYFVQPSDSLLTLLARAESAKIEATEQHFEEVKSILNKEQFPMFKQFKKDALNLILTENEGVNSEMPPPPRGDRGH